jgi:transcriptional regulator with XRE-family HTH domain
MSMADTRRPPHTNTRAAHQRFSPDAFIDAMRDEDMTPQQLADEMGASVEAVARWMAGIAQPKPGYATQAARILKVDVDSLYE